MSTHPASTSPGTPSPVPALEQQIRAVELRMQQRRGALQASWSEVEQKVGQVLAPRVWLWPLGLGAVGGCLLGLLLRRGEQRHAGGGDPCASQGPQGHARPLTGKAWAGAQALLGPWLRSLLTPLMHQWVRPAVLEAGEAVLLALLAGRLKKQAARKPPSAATAEQAPPVPAQPTRAQAPD
ncbi:hypothetical protein ACS5PK_01380 [Roseateles sp. DB2]|uniref:hypothetical protein n=1 Tax=Roseateles sp. DB2 TaxID=3453717 RepID=UPI003EF04A8D